LGATRCIEFRSTLAHFNYDVASDSCAAERANGSRFEEINMKPRIILSVSALSLVIGLGAVTYSAPATAATANPLTALDPDRDGTVDLNEAKTAAGALFDRLDRDHDGTLDGRELRTRLSAKELAAADPDRDGTLTKAEYLAVVEQRFKAADPDNDGTLDRKELRSRTGRALLRLVR
jgi:hypothetical protein